MTKRKYLLRYSLLLIITLIFSTSFAQNTFRTTTKSVIAFLEYLPKDYNNNSNKYPIVIFLHGLGERGANTTDIADLKAGIGRVEKNGPPKHIKNGTEFPFIVISPQLKNNWTDWPTAYVAEIIDYCKTYLRIDERRIYLTGLSLGGGGTWTSAVTFPKLFAAIAPVCGSRNSVPNACLLSEENLGVWAFHGDSDTTIPMAKTVNMINAINACVPAPETLAKITIYPGVNHNSWDNAYTPDHTIHNPNIYDWMLSFTNTINESNKIPVANAGVDQSTAATSIALTGSGLDSDGTIASYSWTKISGPNATLTNSITSKMTASGLSTGVYVFRLRVTDNDGDSDSDYIKVTVNSSVAKPLPIVSAGSDKSLTLPTNSINIIGSASEQGGAIDSYLWSKVSGNAVALAGTTTTTLIVSSLVPGAYVFRLTVIDNAGTAKSDDMTLTVIDGGNTNPTASAGPDRTVILPAIRVTLFGVASDTDGQIVSYKWVKLSGGSCTYSNAAALRPTLTNLEVGKYVFRLTVTDNDGAVKSDEVTMNFVNSTASVRSTTTLSPADEMMATKETSTQMDDGTKFSLNEEQIDIQECIVSIYNENGLQIFEGKWHVDLYNQIFSKNGLYIYQVVRDGIKISGKVLITSIK